MKNLISCNIIEGKPVFTIEPKTPIEYKKGDIVIGELTRHNKPIEYYIWIEGDKDCCQSYVRLGDPQLTLFPWGLTGWGEWEIRRATFQEERCMNLILEREGRELVNGEVRKKRWVPKMGESYYTIKLAPDGLFYYSGPIKRANLDYNPTYCNCFRTEEACSKTVDTLNETLTKIEP